ncbi:MAG: hypothetical protein PWQ06_2732 [Anaerophaga sp.]|nr:hypothetical protein [Anaerophaga sp.]
MAKKGKKRIDAPRSLTTRQLLSKEVVNVVIHSANLSGNNDSYSQDALIMLSKIYGVIYSNDIAMYHIVLMLIISAGVDPYSLVSYLSNRILHQRLYELRQLGYIDKSNKLTVKAQKILDALI